MKYDIIYADPPWDYGSRMKSGPEKNFRYIHVTDHYPTMSGKELLDFGKKVKPICKDNCLLFLWVTGPYMEFSMKVINSWGFDFKTVAFVWDKQRVNMGAYTMSQCEFVLVGKKGKIPKKELNNIKQFLSKKATTHSTKPEEVSDRIHSIFPNLDKIELFARRKKEGWDVFGNEVEGIEL